MRERIDTKVSLADSELVAYQRENQSLRVVLQIWNGSRLSFTFDELIGCIDSGIGDVSEVVVETIPTDFFKSVLQKNYVTVPFDHGYELYQFIDVDGDPSLEIVAKAVSAEPER